MDEDKKVEVANISLKKAKLYFKEGNYGRAFAHYLVVFELSPDEKDDNENDFAHVLCEWGLALEKKKQHDYIYKCYEQALNYFPTSLEILNNFGMQLLRLEQNVVAKQYFSMACALDRDFLVAEKNLYLTKINMLPRWHFRMVNDKVRNVAYYRALKLNISRNYNKVLDIGAGCGLLSLFASKCSPIHSITAVEELPVLSYIANNVFKENKIDNVTLLNKSSTELSGNSCGLHSLLVTEIFDAALFGEHVLKTLIHAWENLLDPSARVIPYSAKLYITGICSKEVYRKHRYLNIGPDLNIGLKDVCLIQENKEPYEAENLIGKEFDCVTTTETVLNVNFNDLEQLKKLHNEEKSIPPVTLKGLKDSEMQAFALWFDLCVDDTNILTTSPFKKDVFCWEQAIIYRNHPYCIKKDEKIELQISCLKDKLQLQEINISNECTECVEVSQDVIMFLNDEKLMQKIVALAESFPDSKNMILELSPFPVFGILMAKKGYKVHCIINRDRDLEFLNHLVQKNKIEDNLLVLSDDAFHALFKMAEVYDMIYFDSVYSNGTIIDKYIAKFEDFKDLLKVDGIMLPRKTSLVVQVVESGYIDKCSKVHDANVFGFKVAEQMNEYAVPELWELNYKTLPHHKLSKPMQVHNIFRTDDKYFETEVEIPITKFGKANAVVYWFYYYFNEDIYWETKSTSYYKIASFLLPGLIVKKGSKLKLKIRQHRGSIKIEGER